MTKKHLGRQITNTEMSIEDIKRETYEETIKFLKEMGVDIRNRVPVKWFKEAGFNSDKAVKAHDDYWKEVLEKSNIESK